MKILLSRSAATLAAAAALSLSVTPALARDGYRHRDRGIDGGDVLAGVLIIGGIAAIAAAASNKSKKDRQARDDARYRDDYRGPDYRGGDYGNDTRAGDAAPNGAPAAGYGDGRYDDQRYDGQRGDAYRDAPAPVARSGYGVDGAVGACVGEVERGNRSVDTVDGVNREGEGWRVAGRVRGGYGFSCVVDRQGRVKSVAGL